MLQSNELRVGNIILLGEVEVTVGGGLIGLINSYERGDTNELGVQEPSGIPLTEDWLLKFGFTYSTGIYSKQDLGAIYIKQQFSNSENFFVKTHKGGGLTAYKYVHQLQNFCFAITGTELTIKEPVNNIS